MSCALPFMAVLWQNKQKSKTDDRQIYMQMTVYANDCTPSPLIFSARHYRGRACELATIACFNTIQWFSSSKSYLSAVSPALISSHATVLCRQRCTAAAVISMQCARLKLGPLANVPVAAHARSFGVAPPPLPFLAPPISPFIPLVSVGTGTVGAT